jgi:CRISPR system Cascade subunit CasB
MTVAEPPRPAAIAAGWWRSLQSAPNGSGGDRAALARLRHSATAMEAALEPATLDLARRLGTDWRDLGRVAVTAAVLAHVRDDARDRPAARQLGPIAGGDAAMSWLRFRRLMQAGTEDEQVVAFRRAVALAGGRLNVHDLAGSLLAWSDDRRRRWILNYHNAPPPAGEGSNPA